VVILPIVTVLGVPSLKKTASAQSVSVGSRRRKTRAYVTYAQTRLVGLMVMATPAKVLLAVPRYIMVFLLIMHVANAVVVTQQQRISLIQR
jgi:uncharacterized membrane protein